MQNQDHFCLFSAYFGVFSPDLWMEYRIFISIVDISANFKNIGIDIDKEISENIDIDKISNRLEFGISNRAIPTSSPSSSICPASSLISDAASQMRFILHCSLLIFCFSLNLSAMSPESQIFNCLVIQQFLCCVVVEQLRGSSLLFVQLRSEPN